MILLDSYGWLILSSIKLTLYVKLHPHFVSDHGEERFKKHQDEGTEEEQVTSFTDALNKMDVSSLS